MHSCRCQDCSWLNKQPHLDLLYFFWTALSSLTFCYFSCLPRCSEHEEPPGDAHHVQSPAASGDIGGQGGRGAGAVLQADPPHFQHLQENEQWVSCHASGWVLICRQLACQRDVSLWRSHCVSLSFRVINLFFLVLLVLPLYQWTGKKNSHIACSPAVAWS